jgi:monoterpene epsilon-lactone hydrolase
MQSLRSRIYYLLTKRALAKSRQRKVPIPQGRLARELQSDRMFRMPKGLSIEPCSVAGVTGEWLRPGVADGDGIVLYLHGGAYIYGSTVTHRGIASKLAIASGCPVLVINYRLAPENPFPAALDDAFAVYAGLLETHPGVPIALAGDSAGGGLALALALKARDEGFERPSALALLSPWTDLTLCNPTHVTKAMVDPYFPDSSLLRSAAQAYGANTKLNHPYVSPQFADLSDMPATLIHVGEFEALLDDARVLTQSMSKYGGSASLRIYGGMWHVWQTYVGRFPEADASVTALGNFLRQQAHSRISGRAR